MSDTATPAGINAGNACRAASPWSRLPDDMLSAMASFLSLAGRVRLSEADRRTRLALLPQLDAEKLQWMLSRVSNLSTLDAALAEIRRQPLRPAKRAEALSTLFDAIALCPYDVHDAACDRLLDAAASLPVPVRGTLLRRMVEVLAPRPPGWTRPQGRPDPPVAGNRLRRENALWAMIDQQPESERISLLVLAVDCMESADFASVNLDHWLGRAVALTAGHRPMTESPGPSISCGGQLLAVLLLRAQEGGLLCDEAGFRRFMAVPEHLWTTDGRPDLHERAVLLADLASALARCEALEQHDSERIWDGLLEAACKLPLDAATPVLLKLAEWFGCRRHASDSGRAGRLWQLARQSQQGSIVVRAQWLAALGSHIPERYQLWHTVWNDWCASAAADRHQAAIALSRAAAALPPLSDGTPAWSAMLRGSMSLAVGPRGAVLAGLAQGLRDCGADAGDTRWSALADAAASLPVTAQLQLLGECMDHDVALARCYWRHYLGLLGQLPPAVIGQTLPFALYLTRDLDRDDAERAWWAVASQWYRAPAEAQAAPWLALFRVVESLYGDDEDQLEQVQSFLEAPLRSQPPVVRRDLLLDAIADLEARECVAHSRWLLSQAESLPSALRAPVLASLAFQALSIESADELLPIWDGLLGATARLPLQYRGGPLHGLQRLYGRLPGAHQRSGRSALLLLCDGVPAIDVPLQLARLLRSTCAFELFQP